jgi:predicted  nucleic acid-binding Zn-ribbon protein
MKIVAKNGVDGFKTVKECLEYEEALDTAEREKKAKEEELKNTEKARVEEIRKSYADLMEKVLSFEKDYKKPVHIPSHGYCSWLF